MRHYVTVGPDFTRTPADEPTRSWVLDAGDEEAAASHAAAVYRSLHPDVGALRVRVTPENQTYDSPAQPSNGVNRSSAATL
jgi:hypothetical protein